MQTFTWGKLFILELCSLFDRMIEKIRINKPSVIPKHIYLLGLTFWKFLLQLCKLTWTNFDEAIMLYENCITGQISVYDVTGM